MALHRIRPRSRDIVMKDEFGTVVPFENGDGSLGSLVDEYAPFWNRRLRDGDVVLVSDEDNAASIAKAQAATAAPEAAPAAPRKGR